ncbi:hypothetical protein QCD60_02165 [Pokkaliibacter sp. MBI-7]|uniref:hypothetical protein n=1 Tax=Pokkaliibacter sp. MBI-7 TaxID=3040600 RepID=UPI00244A0F18|nr:hypothetical protein [Pokkaliibacter sp. MBI-7]MDH2431362.1 hypothetical protein [Pokkaliibacter sp. MBI-7]
MEGQEHEEALSVFESLKDGYGSLIGYMVYSIQQQKLGENDVAKIEHYGKEIFRLERLRQSVDWHQVEQNKLALEEVSPKVKEAFELVKKGLAAQV